MEEISDNPKSAFREILDNERRRHPFVPDVVTTSYVLGADLGQAQDYTALSVVRNHPHYALQVIHLERMVLGTSYPDIVRHVKSLMLNPRLAGKTTLIVDYTGCGRPVVDMIREAGLKCKAISITSGSKAHQEFLKGKALDNFFVPKVDLVSNLTVLMQNHKLEIAKGLKDGPTLAKELKSFKAKISASGHVSYEASASWRESEHDDLVLSVALACYWATKSPTPRVRIPMRMMASISRLP